MKLTYVNRMPTRVFWMWMHIAETAREQGHKKEQYFTVNKEFLNKNRLHMV